MSGYNGGSKYVAAKLGCLNKNLQSKNTTDIIVESAEQTSTLFHASSNLQNYRMETIDKNPISDCGFVLLNLISVRSCHFSSVEID